MGISQQNNKKTFSLRPPLDASFELFAIEEGNLIKEKFLDEKFVRNISRKIILEKSIFCVERCRWLYEDISLLPLPMFARRCNL